MKPKLSAPYSQKPTTGRCREIDVQFIPYAAYVRLFLSLLTFYSGISPLGFLAKIFVNSMYLVFVIGLLCNLGSSVSA